MYYLNSVSQAKEEIRRRKKDRVLVQSILDGHIERQFGIRNFSQLISNQVSASAVGTAMPINCETTYGVLARQVPGLSVEDIACYMLSRRLGLTPCALAFTRDTFHSGSNDKLFRVKVPFASWSKKGNLVVVPNSVLGGGKSIPYSELDMLRLDRLSANGVPLPIYHRSMQQRVFSHFQEPYIWGDVSPLWGEILAQTREAGKAPNPIWRAGPDHKDTLSNGTYTVEEARALTVRPSSKWYYHLYLSMFLDGTFVLLETYDNETGGVPEARRLFEKEMDKIHQVTGFMPLVVKTYPLRPDMLYVNQHIIDEPQKASRVLENARYWSEDTVSMTRWFADQVLQVGR